MVCFNPDGMGIPVLHITNKTLMLVSYCNLFDLEQVNYGPCESEIMHPMISKLEYIRYARSKYTCGHRGGRREEKNKCLLMITATRSKIGKCFEEGNYGQLLCGRKRVPTSVIHWPHHLALPLMTINMGFT
jgi:hypothetical protein